MHGYSLYDIFNYIDVELKIKSEMLFKVDLFVKAVISDSVV